MKSRTQKSAVQGLRTLLSLLCILSAGFAGNPDKHPLRHPQSPDQVLGTPVLTNININNFTSFYRADGEANHDPTDNAGGRFPRGTATCIYEDGFVWGGKTYLDSGHTIPSTQLIRVGGQAYNEGTRHGWIVGLGGGATQVPPTHPRARIYRIRRDYYSMSAAELRADAAILNGVPEGEVTQAQMDAVANQYATDWTEWPVDLGAPYVERNASPGYQAPPPFGPSFTVDSLISGMYDEPGVCSDPVSHPADQVVWTVYNDLDRTATLDLYRSEPIGLEGQVTIWGYKRNDAVGQLHFKRLRLINKGGVIIGGTTRGSFYIDSMYISQWADPDLGDAGDDLCGSDTLLNLGYAYNGYPVDFEYHRFRIPPPAAGYRLIAGPIVYSPGDSAIFDFRWVPNRKNLPMTAFVYFAAGSPISDPPLGNQQGGSYESTLRWFRMLRGLRPDMSGVPERFYPFPPGITPGPFCLSGDPVSQTGFVDGLGEDFSFGPGDRRTVLCTGPFALAPGDTQEIIVATVGGLGSDRLSSISVMKHNSRVAQGFAKGLFTILPPLMTSRVTYPGSSNADVRLFADARQISPLAVRATFIEPPSTFVTDLDLFDDGTHGDTVAHDGIWTNTVTLLRRTTGLNVDVTATYPQSAVFQWERLLERVTTAGPLLFQNFRVFSDNINNNGEVNPGENVRYGFTTVNAGLFGLQGLQVFPDPEPYRAGRSIVSLPVGGRDSMLYVPGDPTTYFRLDVPGEFTDSILNVEILTLGLANNMWVDTLRIPVDSLPAPVNTVVQSHLSGQATGTFEIITVSPGDIRNHLYILRGVDSINAQGDRGITLKDSTDSRVLLFNHPFPDSLAHAMPITDGFRIRRGNVDLTYGFLDWQIPNGERRFTWVDADLGFEGFNGAIGWDDPAHFFGITPTQTTPARNLRNVLIKLAEAHSDTARNPGAGNNPYGGWDVNNPGNDPDFSYSYRYLRAATAPPARPEFAPYIVNPTGGYAYQDYRYGVPVSAWDVDASPPLRLAVGFLENNTTSGLVDGKWWPPANGTGVRSLNVRDWLFIFDRPYTGPVPAAELQIDILNNGLPVMWWVSANRKDGNDFSAGDEFLIRTKHPPGSQDAWTFNPTIVLSVEEPSTPLSFGLDQNYPNPFNPTTTIRYQLPGNSNVAIRIYNVLGQEIRTLVNEVKGTGTHSSVWDGTNNAGRAVATGVYFYRLTADGVMGKAMSFTLVKKMLLLK